MAESARSAGTTSSEEHEQADGPRFPEAAWTALAADTLPPTQEDPAAPEPQGKQDVGVVGVDVGEFEAADISPPTHFPNWGALPPEAPTVAPSCATACAVACAAACAAGAEPSAAAQAMALCDPSSPKNSSGYSGHGAGRGSRGSSSKASTPSMPSNGSSNKGAEDKVAPLVPEAPRASGQAPPNANGASSQDDNAEVGTEDKLDTTELVLLHMIGSGAQAEVYKGVWWRRFGCTTSAITVAVKRLHASSQHRIDCECLATNILHPNLVRCFAAVTSSSPHLIVSEYCAGGSLHDCIHIKQAQWSWSQRLNILWDIAKGMEHLHSLDPIIVHRDLKSQNALLTQSLENAQYHPRAKVADFGLSRVLRSSSNFLTRCVGSWRWMAPEVFSTNSYDERVDVFSFGMLMFEVLTQEIPYTDAWPLTSTINPRVSLHIVSGQRPNIRLVQKGCPGKVVQLMQECWANTAKERPNFISIKEQLHNQLELVALYMNVKERTFML